MCWLSLWKAVGESIYVCEVGIDIDVCFVTQSASNPSPLLILIHSLVFVCRYYTQKGAPCEQAPVPLLCSIKECVAEEWWF